jgi:hypothetical protein
VFLDHAHLWFCRTFCKSSFFFQMTFLISTSTFCLFILPSTLSTMVADSLFLFNII